MAWTEIHQVGGKVHSEVLNRKRQAFPFSILRGCVATLVQPHTARRFDFTVVKALAILYFCFVFKISLYERREQEVCLCISKYVYSEGFS